MQSYIHDCPRLLWWPLPPVMSDVRPELSQLSVELSSLTWGEVISMAVQLGVEFSTLQQIKEDNSEQNVRLLAAMNDWLSNDHEASWRKVVDALKTIDKNVLADGLATKYCARSTQSELFLLESCRLVCRVGWGEMVDFGGQRGPCLLWKSWEPQMYWPLQIHYSQQPTPSPGPSLSPSPLVEEEGFSRAQPHTPPPPPPPPPGTLAKRILQWCLFSPPS